MIAHFSKLKNSVERKGADGNSNCIVSMKDDGIYLLNLITRRRIVRTHEINDSVLNPCAQDHLHVLTQGATIFHVEFVLEN